MGDGGFHSNKWSKLLISSAKSCQENSGNIFSPSSVYCWSPTYGHNPLPLLALAALEAAIVLQAVACSLQFHRRSPWLVSSPVNYSAAIGPFEQVPPSGNQFEQLEDCYAEKQKCWAHMIRIIIFPLLSHAILRNMRTYEDLYSIIW